MSIRIAIDESEASDDELSVGPHCGHCGQKVPTTHIHHSADGPWSFVTTMLRPCTNACNGDDLCDDCIEAQLP
jgi:hypothetical protein